MSNPLRSHPIAVASAGVILGLGVGLAATAQATTTSPSSTSQTSPSSASSSSATPPPPPPGGPGRGGHGPGGGGTLSAVSSSSITYAGPDGSAHTAALNGSTTYAKDGAAAQQTDLAVGERVNVRLADPTASTPTVARVEIHSPHLDGTVTSDNAGVIIVVDGDGFHRTIHTGMTSYTNNGQAATSSAVVAGQHINAVGSIDPNGTDLDATRVDVGRPPRPTPPNSSGPSSTGSSSTTKAP
ncbi:MAG: hypothetical protein NVS3B21_24060 [Acidimicrobiales bacterium]